MLTLLSSNYKPELVTTTDLEIASIAWEFTVGIGLQHGKLSSRQQKYIDYMGPLSLTILPFGCHGLGFWLV
jgi:hypothetical protein